MNCPQCGHQLSEDFGVVTCQNCFAVMSIDLDGKIFLQEKKEINQVQLEVTQVEEQQTNEDLSNDELFSLDSFDQPSQQEEKKIEEEIQETDLDQSQEQPSVEEVTAQKYFTEDIISFAENTTTSDKLIYKVIISDLNLTEQKQKLVDILSDPKFHLSASKLLGEIKEGTLTISELNSVKASILVKKLLMEKFHVDWTQNAY